MRATKCFDVQGRKVVDSARDSLVRGGVLRRDHHFSSAKVMGLWADRRRDGGVSIRRGPVDGDSGTTTAAAVFDWGAHRRLSSLTATPKGDNRGTHG
jgi:hypothetical protein